MPSIAGVTEYIVKCYRRQQASAQRLELLVRQLVLPFGGTLLEAKMEEQRIGNILMEMRKLMNESADLGSMRRLLATLKLDVRIRN